MSKKKIYKQSLTPSRRIPWLWIAGVMLLLLIGGAWGWSTFVDSTDFIPQVTGAPRLAVDQTTIDEGDVKLGQTVRSAFRLQNVGDQPLAILGEPQVQVVEGC